MDPYLPAFPPAGTAERPALTGLTCPACPGVLSVQSNGGSLVLACRIGHVFVVPELVVVKEQRVEQLLWSAVEALEELRALLGDAHLDEPRAERAGEEAARLRDLIAGIQPVRIDGLIGNGKSDLGAQ